MPLKDILVLLDSRPSSPARLELALNLARRHGARLIALFPLPAAALRLGSDTPQAAAAALRNIFEERTAREKLSASWISDEGHPGEGYTEIVLRHAHCADLVLVGQTHPERQEESVPVDLPERLVLAAGRPVLVVPYAGRFAVVGRRAVIGWRGGRESTRAIHDALGVLHGAERVELLTVLDSDQGDGIDLMTDSLCAHLINHGIPVGTKQMAGGPVGVGDVLLNRISDDGADLLVMGVYAQTRFGNLTLGEVGRHLLKHMTVPVLMSH